MKQEGSSKAVIYRVQALERALDILDAFSHRRRKMHLSEVAAQVGLKKATAKRLLANLTHRGYLKFDTETKAYELGMRLFEMGSIVRSGFSIRKVADAHMRWLRDQTGLTVLLGQCQENDLVYIEKYDGTGPVQIASTVGERRPLHFGMLGQVLMAYLPRERVRSVLEVHPLQPFTPQSIVEIDTLWRRLDRIRENGFIVEKGEAHQGIMGFAAPIRGATGDVLAALGAALPLPDYVGTDEIEFYLKTVRQAAENISAELGYIENERKKTGETNG